MGVVYRAHDQRLDRKVAIKLVPEEIAGAGDHRARVMAEARAASALSHPNIVTIHEIGEDGGRLFIVMELVTGETLRSQLARGPMEAKALTRLGAQVAEVLAAAHGRGVVHGDIKPENIMVQSGGQIKLLDLESRAAPLPILFPSLVLACQGAGRLRVTSKAPSHICLLKAFAASQPTRGPIFFHWA